MNRPVEHSEHIITGALCDRASGTCMCEGQPCANKVELSSQEQAAQQEEAKQDAALQKEIFEKSKTFCSANGQWNEDIGKCDCATGFHGENCQIKHCAGFNETAGTDDCHDHGLCIDGVCKCLRGFGTLIQLGRMDLGGGKDVGRGLCPYMKEKMVVIWSLYSVELFRFFWRSIIGSMMMMLTCW